MENRREFLKKAGVIATGSVLLGSCVGKVSEVKKSIGLQLYTVRNQIDESLETTLKKISEIGYTHIESAGHGGNKYYSKTAIQYRELLKSLNLTPISGHYSTGIANPDDIGTLSNGWDKALDEMNEIGQKYAVLGYLREEERKSIDDYKRVAELLNTAGEKAKKKGIQLCYHNHDFEFVEIDGQLPMYYLLDNVSPDLLKMELDLFWITKAGYSIKDFFSKYEGRIPLWHVKDMNDEGDFTEVGSGRVDFETAFANKELAGMEYFFVEQDQSEDPIKSIRKSYTYVENNLVE
ncbi:MAG: sugar phosphate isomerase/epimerase [Cyclobacteriaceae bacterium]